VSPSASTSISSSPSPSAASPIITGPRLPLYIRITNPWFLEQDSDGRPAVGYRVYTLVAGTVSTLVETYSDRELTVPNTNPVVLNAYGEARIFTDIDLKLVYTSPTGDLTSPIWTEDYVAEQQSVVSDKEYGLYAGTNNYTVDIVPAYTSIPDGFSLVMMPDKTNLGTLVIQPGHTVPTVFTGTGINDGVFSGAYIGTVAGAIFAVTIDSCYIAAPIAVTLAANVAPGSVTAGNHSVKVTAVTAVGESAISTASNIINAAGGAQLDVSGILAIAGAVTGYNIYMSKAGGSTWYFVALVTTTTYTINVADAALTVAAPTGNTTADTVSWQIDGGAITSYVPITGLAQSLQDGIYITFAGYTSHTLGDKWVVTVMTPTRMDFCGLGNDLIYKSSGGLLVVLDAADIIAGYPAHLDRSNSQSCWILINPSLPVLEGIIPLRVRKIITGDYIVDPLLDQGTEISAASTVTITLPNCSDAVSHFFYFNNSGTGVVTIDAGTFNIDFSGVHSLTLGTGDTAQLGTNGVDWHTLSTNFAPKSELFDTPGTVTWVAARPTVQIAIGAGGGGGAGGEAAGVLCGVGGSAGVVKTRTMTVVPGTSYMVTVGAAGAAGVVDGNGGAGGVSSIANGGTLITCTGGAGGVGVIACTDLTRSGGVNDVATGYGSYSNGGTGGGATGAGAAGLKGFVFLSW
jgi:hypothetical protein